LHDPFIGFIAVSSSRPTPQRLEECIIYLLERLFANDVAVISSPPINDGIELDNEITSRGLLVGFNDRPYLDKYCFETVMRWFDEQLATIFAYILP